MGEGGAAVTGYDDEDPLSIFLVISGSRGKRMLFRYPFQNASGPGEGSESTDFDKILTDDVLYQNPYRMKATPAENLTNNSASSSSSSNTKSFFDSDGELATLMAPKPVLCDQQFELKIGQVRNLYLCLYFLYG